MSETVDLLDAMWELNKREIESILKYREGGGLERVVETSRRLNFLTEAQINILEKMIVRDAKRDAK